MKITELMHLLGEALDAHGDVEVVMEHAGDIPGCGCNDARNLTYEDDWWAVGISRTAIVTPVDNSPEIDRGIMVKSVVLFGE